MDLYREQLLDHYRQPHNRGLLEQAEYQAQGRNPLCGDEITVQLVLKDKRIVTIRHEGHGCVISQAAASLLSDFLVSKSTTESKQVTLKNVESLLGTTLPPSRISCGMLALETIQQALKDV
jgi:nitrogen fixation protein NifU and related proteins